MKVEVNIQQHKQQFEYELYALVQQEAEMSINLDRTKKRIGNIHAILAFLSGLSNEHCPQAVPQDKPKKTK